jgi:phosphate acetyltransferase
MQLPGAGTLYLGQTLKFLKPVTLGDTITASVKVLKKDDTHKHITFETLCVNQKGVHIIKGEALVLAPSEKIHWETLPLPEVQIKTPAHNYEQWLMNKIVGLAPLKVAVVHPVDIYSLVGAIEAAKAGVIEAILIGPQDKIRKTAQDAHIDLSDYKIVPTLHSHAAAALAVEMARTGEVEAIMKDKLHTDELMEAVVKKENGLRTARRISHVFVLDVPRYPKPLFLTDAAINIKPDLMAKKDIVQNAIDLFTTVGCGIPKVAILSAVEIVTEKFPRHSMQQRYVKWHNVDKLQAV